MNRKPIRISRVTYGQPCNAPNLDTVFWTDLEKILKVKLEFNTREQFSTIIQAYITDAGHIQSGAGAIRLLKKRKSKLVSLGQSLRKAETLFNQIYGHKEYSDLLITLDAKISSISFHTSMADAALSISAMGAAIDASRQDCGVRVSTKRANETIPDPYSIYISKIADALEGVGVRVTRTKPTDNSKKHQKLIYCLKYINEKLPEKVRKPSKSFGAYAQDIYRALISGQK